MFELVELDNPLAPSHFALGAAPGQPVGSGFSKAVCIYAGIPRRAQAAGEAGRGTRYGHAWHHLHHPEIAAIPRLREFTRTNGSVISILKTLLPPPLLGVTSGTKATRARLAQVRSTWMAAIAEQCPC